MDTNPKIGVFVFFLCIFFVQVFGQHQEYRKLEYISPEPGSRFVMPMNNIAIRSGDKFDLGSIRQSLLVVTKSKEIKIEGELNLSDDEKTLIFKPKAPYPLGEIIHVELMNGLKTIKGDEIEAFEFYFTVTPKIIDNPQKYLIDDIIFDQKSHLDEKRIEKKKQTEVKENNLPEGFPGYEVNLINPSTMDEYYFMTSNDDWGWFPDTEPFTLITDIYGTPVYYKKMKSFAYDLKIQPSGYLSYYSYNPGFCHKVMDTSYQIIDTYKMGNGYGYTDFHEFQLLENGHSFVMTYDGQLYPMDTVVPGGDSNAIVVGFVFQELDTNKDVVFQWRSWDHFLITDAGSFVDLTDSIIDYVHGNAIELDSDSTLLISCRNLEEITKIDRNTGDIIWRFGGENNQFEFENDTLGFSVQHDIRKLPSGNISLFDNGSKHPDPKFSSALEYHLDEVNLKATLVNRFRHEPDVLGYVMGNLQNKPDGSKVVGWGSAHQSITEFDSVGEVLYEMKFEAFSYRSYRFPWKTNYFLTDNDTLDFGNVYYPDSLEQEILIMNNAGYDINITSIYNLDSVFYSLEEFPILVPDGDSVPIKIIFDPNTVSNYSTLITINSDINTDTLIQRVAQQVFLMGYGSPNQSGIEEMFRINARIYPSPVNDLLTIEILDINSETRLRLYDISGKLLYSTIINGDGKSVIDMNSFKSGLYFIQLEENQSGKSGYYKIIKN
jgi:hypothetical protein